MPPNIMARPVLTARCIDCGYDLAGHGAESVCPECGTPVEASLKPDVLHCAEERWLRKMALASLCFAMSGWLYLEILVVLLTSMFVFLDDPLGEYLYSSLGAAWVASGVSMSLGLIFLSTAERRDALVERSPWRRQILRSLGIVTAVLMACGWLGPLGMLDLVSVACLIVLPVAAFLALRYARGLACRVPDAVLAKRASRAALRTLLIGIVTAAAGITSHWVTVDVWLGLSSILSLAVGGHALLFFRRLRRAILKPSTADQTAASSNAGVIPEITSDNSPAMPAAMESARSDETHSPQSL